MFQNSVSQSPCELFEDDGPDRPHWLPEMSLYQRRAIEMADRVITAATEFKRQMVMDESDTGFVPAPVLRQLHTYVMNDPTTTVAAVVGRSVKMLFQNYLNAEEIGPELAKIILAGRPVEPMNREQEIEFRRRLDARERKRRRKERVEVIAPTLEPEAVTELPEPEPVVEKPKREPWRPAPFVPLTDAEWERCEAVLPPEKATGRPRETDLRGVMDAVAHHWRTGCPWRMMPESVPPWQTSYTHFKQWLKAGITPELRAIVAPRGAR